MVFFLVGKQWEEGEVMDMCRSLDLEDRSG
jgi:hypothetical protein